MITKHVQPYLKLMQEQIHDGFQHGFIFCSIYYKKLQRCWKPAVNQDGGDAISNVPAPAKPVLGLYLIGWGLGVILCGIVAAINNLQHYDNQD